MGTIADRVQLPINGKASPMVTQDEFYTSIYQFRQAAKRLKIAMREVAATFAEATPTPDVESRKIEGSKPSLEKPC